MSDSPTALDPRTFKSAVSAWARDLGFATLGVTDTDLAKAEPKFKRWLADQMHGSMDYMLRSADQRLEPSQLVAGATRVILVTMNYSPTDPAWIDKAWANLDASERAYISRYALGRDYHKVVRSRLQKLASKMESQFGSFGYRVFCDSAPVMEVELAQKAGLGWRGKHSLLLSREQGSSFFIGSMLTDLDIPIDGPVTDHCGRCTACMDICPTRAIVAPYVVDARLCISYLTIEHHGAIAPELRPLMGNRIYGCDDCQLACPWNKFSKPMAVPDFATRNQLDDAGLIDLFKWDQTEFEKRTQGSPIRRIGHERWLRNIAVALGNARTLAPQLVINVLQGHCDHASAMVREHVQWAIDQQLQRTL